MCAASYPNLLTAVVAWRVHFITHDFILKLMCSLVLRLSASSELLLGV